MKRKVFLAGVVATSLLAVKGQADDSAPPNPPINPHRVFIGPDIFYNHVKTSWHFWGTAGKVDSKTLFYGLRAGYEYVNPKHIYWGIEGGNAYGRDHVKSSEYLPGSEPEGIFSTPQYLEKYPLGYYKAHTTDNFANIEGRVGYTFGSYGHFLLTPYTGIGFYHFSSHGDFHRRKNWSYLAAGLHMTKTVTTAFDIGLNLKGMWTLTVDGFSHESLRIVVRHCWGYEVDLPLTWHATEQWDVQVEPYFTKLDTQSDEKIWGGRLLVGYSF